MGAIRGTISPEIPLVGFSCLDKLVRRFLQGACSKNEYSEDLLTTELEKKQEKVSVRCNAEASLLHVGRSAGHSSG